MAKIEFIPKKFRGDSLALIKTANSIIADYQRQGFRLTLRQLYYQCVVKNIFPNTERSYKRLGSILNDARYAGLVDWAAIEDRNRQPEKAGQFSGLPQLAKAAMHSYRLDRWEGQKNFVELWVEKAALAGVLSPLAREWHVTLMVNRGYSSASAMYESAMRLARRRGQNPVVLYLGDHDPSGEDMVRDIDNRFTTFGVPCDVVKVALTMAQVEQYNPPPNPAKTTDSRYDKYASEHGDESWEVDALPPDVLGRLIRKAISSRVDRRKMEKVLKQEQTDKQRFADALQSATDGEAELDDDDLKVSSPPWDSNGEEE